MTIEALINFYDTKNNNQLRKKGEQFEVSGERGKYLLSMRAVKEVPATKKPVEKKSAEKQNTTSEK